MSNILKIYSNTKAKQKTKKW